MRSPQGDREVGLVAATAEPTDGELLARFSARRDDQAESAFEALVRRHGPMVLRVCRQVLGDPHAAEDAFQATFLVLSRRARSVRRPELLGNWLHGVALRTAREARMRDDRRRRREAPSGAGMPEESVAPAPWPDLEAARREELGALHEEVARLPDRYRLPVILCELEGLTQREAAHRLRCPTGTIGVRLIRARERLRARLVRRGIALTAGLLAALRAGEADAEAVPSTLVRSTVRAAMGPWPGQTAGPGLPMPPALALSRRVLRRMALRRLAAPLGVALAIGIAAALHAGATPREPALAAQESGPSRPDTQGPAAILPPVSGPAVPAASTSFIAADRTAARASSEAPSAALAIPEVSSRAADERGITRASLGRATTAGVPLGPPSRPGPPREQAEGALLFAKEWIPDDPRSPDGDGLGPVYNETSCVGCHSLGAPGGAGPESKNVVLVMASPGGCGPSTSPGQLVPALRTARTAVLHHYSTDPGYPVWRDRLTNPQADAPSEPAAARNSDPVASRIRELRERTTPGRRALDRAAGSPGMNASPLAFVERNTPPLFGLGRVDGIPSEVLVAVAEAQPREVRGRVGRTPEGRIGRFGWKAQIPSLHEFVRVACANELGLEVPGHPQAPSPLSPGTRARGLDLTEAQCDALVSYVRALPAPVVVDPDGPQGTRDLREGRRLFEEVGCAVCHAPTLGDIKGIYSDLLLHDMGQSLGDPGGSYGLDGPNTARVKGPSPREWRTPPLWGYRDSGPYLHDGRAQGLEEAVALHDGQAKASARRFFSLSWRQRGQVEAFLKSLVAPSAAAAPGLMLAAELESRIEAERHDAPESRVRHEREEAVARDERRWREARRHEFAQDAAKRARARLPLARSLEKMGKTAGAIAFYREIARDAAGTEEGRLAAERISELSPRGGTP